MKRTSQNYFLASLVFFIVSLGAWSSFIFFVHELHASADVLAVKTAQAYQKRNEIVSAQNLVADTATSSQILYGAFASSTDIAGVIAAIETEGTADSVSASVRSIATASSSDPALLTLDMDITASGSWADLVTFAGNVERLPFAMALTKASFFSDGSKKGGWSLSAHVTSFLSP